LAGVLQQVLPGPLLAGVDRPGQLREVDRLFHDRGAEGQCLWHGATPTRKIGSPNQIGVTAGARLSGKSIEANAHAVIIGLTRKT
jgi:hypothetical protein